LLITAASFGIAVWVAGAFVLPPLMRSAADRWVVAAGLGVAVAASAALWGQWWATQEGRPDTAGEADRARVDTRVAASGKRSIAAGRDISGIASTGDGAANTQQQ
jgi:hypothetical protein